MKSIISVMILSIILLTGCSTTNTIPYLQSVEQNGAPMRNTIKITKNEKENDITLRASVIFNRDKQVDSYVKGHSPVNEFGEFETQPVQGEDYQLEYANVNENDFEGNNFHWILPDFESHVEMEYNISSHVSFYGGVAFAESKELSFLNYNFGGGFFREEENWAIRLDIASAFEEMIADAEYILVENVKLNDDNSRKVYFFNTRSKHTYLNINVGVTINTKYQDWFVNGFLNYTTGRQSFYNIAIKDTYYDEKLISYDDNFENSDSYHSISLGLYKEIDNLGKLIGGARFTKYTDSKGRLFIPDYFLQFDLELF